MVGCRRASSGATSKASMRARSCRLGRAGRRSICTSSQRRVMGLAWAAGEVALAGVAAGPGAVRGAAATVRRPASARSASRRAPAPSSSSARRSRASAHTAVPAAGAAVAEAGKPSQGASSSWSTLPRQRPAWVMEPASAAAGAVPGAVVAAAPSGSQAGPAPARRPVCRQQWSSPAVATRHCGTMPSPAALRGSMRWPWRRVCSFTAQPCPAVQALKRLGAVVGAVQVPAQVLALSPRGRRRPCPGSSARCSWSGLGRRQRAADLHTRLDLQIALAAARSWPVGSRCRP